MHSPLFPPYIPPKLLLIISSNGDFAATVEKPPLPAFSQYHYDISTMPLPDVTRNASPTTSNEFLLMMHVHEYLIRAGPWAAERRKLNARKRLAWVTGVSEKVAQEAIRMYKTGEVPCEAAVGRPKRELDPELARKIRELVLNGNKNGVPMHSKLLVAELAKQDTVVNVRTLQRHLSTLGFHYGKGNRRNILHDTKANIDFRNAYLEKRLGNLNSNGLPVHPEVFLDESYCHLDHHARLTWVPVKGVVNERGRKPMLVILVPLLCFDKTTSWKQICTRKRSHMACQRQATRNHHSQASSG